MVRQIKAEKYRLRHIRQIYETHTSARMCDPDDHTQEQGAGV